MSETVACIITSYNNWPYLPKALESVLAQSRRPDEIVISDDGSGDGSREYLREIAREHPEIRLTLREQNIGVNENRDLALRSARSTFVTTLDGDDIYYPQKIAREMKALKGRLDTAAFSDVANLDGGGRVLEVPPLAALASRNPVQQLSYLLNMEGPSPRDLLYSKQLYEESGGFRPMKMYGDWDFKLRLAYHSKGWLYSGVKGVGYRQHGLGISRGDVLSHVLHQLRIIGDNRDILVPTIGEKEIYLALLRCVARGTGARSVQLLP